MAIKQMIENGSLRLFGGGVIDSSVDTSLPLIALNAKHLRVELKEQLSARLVVAYTESCQSVVEIDVARGASLELVEIYLADSYANITINQAEGSHCKTFSALLSSSNVTYTNLLSGCHASNTFDALFIATGSDHSTLNLTTRHLVADCKSASVIKGVASGKATGEFKGLVYVAQDAQRTDAQQTNRNIELGGGHIVSEPQLEIYADDVKCSHGSTVGQLDEQAIYYMRQRGISQESAERLLLEGFVEDVVAKCEVEALQDMLNEAVQAKLNQ